MNDSWPPGSARLDEIPGGENDAANPSQEHGRVRVLYRCLHYNASPLRQIRPPRSGRKRPTVVHWFGTRWPVDFAAESTWVRSSLWLEAAACSRKRTGISPTESRASQPPATSAGSRPKHVVREEPASPTPAAAPPPRSRPSTTLTGGHLRPSCMRFPHSDRECMEHLPNLCSCRQSSCVGLIVRGENDALGYLLFLCFPQERSDALPEVPPPSVLKFGSQLLQGHRYAVVHTRKSTIRKCFLIDYEHFLVLPHQVQKTIVRRFVLAQFPLIRHADGLSPPRRRRGGTRLRTRGRVMEMEQWRREAHRQVTLRHLVALRPRRHLIQEFEYGLQRFSVLVRQQQNHPLNGLVSHWHRNILKKKHRELSVIHSSRVFFLKERHLRWKMDMNVSESLFVSNASGNSLKYCFTMSATSYAWWPS